MQPRLNININNRINKLNTDKFISIALMSSYVILTIQYFILLGFNLFGTTLGSQLQILSKILVGFVYLIGFPKVLKNNFKLIMITYLLSGLIFLGHYVIFRDNRMIMQSQFFNIFFMSIPSFIYAVSLNDYFIFKSVMIKASYIVFFIGVLIFFLVLSNIIDFVGYSMALSYYMLLPTIILMDKLFDNFSIIILIMVLISIIIILSLGARGPFIGIFLFSILKIIKLNVIITKRTLFIIILIILFLILSILFIDNILEYINRVLLYFGIKSRTINSFLDFKLDTSGRTEIYSLAIEQIKNRPILGWGIFGDRIAVDRIDYVHNFYLEILLNYGVVLGFLLIFVLMCLIIYVIVKQKGITYKVFIIWVSLGFAQLIVSGSYLIEIKFWIFLGLLINIVFFKYRNNSRNII